MKISLQENDIPCNRSKVSLYAEGITTFGFENFSFSKLRTGEAALSDTCCMETL